MSLNLRKIRGYRWPVLPPGIHWASLHEVETAFATDGWRRELFDGLVDASGRLRAAGCSTLYLDGSFVTGKPEPGDFDACWDPSGVDVQILDSVFLNFAQKRKAQKATFKGEFFVASNIASGKKTFLEFFQTDRDTGGQKGIVAISLSTDPLLSGKESQ